MSTLNDKGSVVLLFFTLLWIGVKCNKLCQKCPKKVSPCRHKNGQRHGRHASVTPKKNTLHIQIPFNLNEADSDTMRYYSKK